jgi:hypothetical protein
MINFNEDIIIYWEQKTSIKIEQFLFDYFDFFKSSYPVIYAFYTGNILEINSTHIQRLGDLITAYEDIETQIISRSGVFTSVLDSEIIEQLSSYQVELMVIKKLNKFLRSNITNPAYSKFYEFDSVLKQATIEELSAQVLGSDNYQNDWAGIAEKNDLQEFEYEPEGGNNLLVSVQLASKITPINSIIDVITGQTVLGKDIDKILTWENDDLKTLGYEDTFKQSVEILLGLKQGDIPEFRDLGRNVYPGSSMKLFAFSPLLRQLTQVFSSDDSIQRFNVSKIKVMDADITFEVEVYSRLEEIINKQIII